MPSDNDPIDAWLREAESTDLVAEDDRNAQGIGNMLVFTQVATFARGQVAATLVAIADVYGSKATAAGMRGIFYAWVDEMAGQLRCSFCRVERAGDLPFGCLVREVADVAPFAERAVVALRQISDTEEPPPSPDPYVLDVWCTALPRT